MDFEKRLSRLEQILRNLQIRLADLEKENAGLIYRMDVSHSTVVESTLKNTQAQIERLEKDIANLSYRIDENFTTISDLLKSYKKRHPGDL